MNIITQYKGLRKENYILFIARIVTNLGAMVWPMLTMILNQKMGFSATKVSLLMLVAGLILMPTSLIGGRLADRYNKKHCIIICDLISVAFYIISAFIPLSMVTIVLLLFAAACQNMEYPSFNALIADITHTTDREKAYSLQYLGANLGLVVAPTLAGILFTNHLSLAFFISGVSICFSTVLMFFKLKDISPVEDSGEESAYQEAQENESLFSILRKNKVILLYIFIMAAYYAAYQQYGYLMPLDMGQVHGSQGAIIYGSVSSLNCIIVVICTPLITRLFQKLISPKKTLVGELLVMVGYFLFLTLLGNIPIYYVAIALFTFGEIFTTIADGPYISTRVPASHRGRINGLNTVATSILQSVCLIVIGPLYDHFGSVTAWTFVIGILLVATAATIVLIFADKKHYKNIYS